MNVLKMPTLGIWASFPDPNKPTHHREQTPKSQALQHWRWGHKEEWKGGPLHHTEEQDPGRGNYTGKSRPVGMGRWPAVSGQCLLGSHFERKLPQTAQSLNARIRNVRVVEHGGGRGHRNV